NALNTYEMNVRDMIDQGNGFFPAFDQNDNPLTQRVVTPGHVIAESVLKWIGAGTDILVQANEIEQIPSQFLASLQAKIAVDTYGGLPGLSTPSGGQPSYLGSLTGQTSADVRTTAI